MAASIVVDAVNKSFTRKQRVLVDVSFTVGEGECVGVIGPNGAGKTTLFGCLLGLLRPDSGSVTISAQAPDALPVRARTGYVPERLEFDPTLTARQLIALRHELLGLPRAVRAAEVEAQLEQVGLVDAARARALRTFSRGMLQRLGLAHALIGAPRWLFLDEPTLGIDPEGAAHLRALLGSLKARGVTVIINSHDLAHLERVCERVVLLRAGKVAAIETLSTGAADLALCVRWVGRANPDVLSACAAAAGATLVGVDASKASLRVADEAAAARLVEELLRGGVAVSLVEREVSRLERFFGEEPRA